MAIKKKTGSELPRFNNGKTYKYNRYPRFVDLNKGLNEIVEYAENTYIPAPSNPQNGDTVVFQNGDWVSGQSGSGGNLQTTIVEISDIEIQSMNSSNILLLPNLSEPNQYYALKRLIFEFDPGNIPFSLSGDEYFFIHGLGDIVGVFSVNSMLTGINKVAFIVDLVSSRNYFSNPEWIRYQGEGIIMSGSKEISLRAFNLVDITNGDGTARVIIDYNVLTFGE
jgi:hypothetical protein